MLLLSSSKFKRLVNVRRQFGSQRGSAMTEFALTVPILVVLILGMVDIGALLLNYMQFEQAAREGVRTAGRLPSLAAGAWTSTNDADTVTQAGVCTVTPTDPSCDHVLVHARVRYILRLENTWYVDIPETDILSDFQPPPVGIPVGIQDTVMVRVNGLYTGIFFSYNMNVSMRGPWLF